MECTQSTLNRYIRQHDLLITKINSNENKYTKHFCLKKDLRLRVLERNSFFLIFTQRSLTQFQLLAFQLNKKLFYGHENNF